MNEHHFLLYILITRFKVNAPLGILFEVNWVNTQAGGGCLSILSDPYLQCRYMAAQDCVERAVQASSD